MIVLGTILGIILSGLIGYLLGYAKFFREEKQRAYTELFPVIAKVSYLGVSDRTKEIENELNIALSKLWLYASRKVALKMSEALSIIDDPTRGNITECLQLAIIEMRRDMRFVGIWPFWPFFPRLKPEDISHIQLQLK